MIFWKRPTKEIDSCEFVGLSDIYGDDKSKKDLLNLCLLQVW